MEPWNRCAAVQFTARRATNGARSEATQPHYKWSTKFYPSRVPADSPRRFPEFPPPGRRARKCSGSRLPDVAPQSAPAIAPTARASRRADRRQTPRRNPPRTRKHPRRRDPSCAAIPFRAPPASPGRGAPKEEAGSSAPVFFHRRGIARSVAGPRSGSIPAMTGRAPGEGDHVERAAGCGDSRDRARLRDRPAMPSVVCVSETRIPPPA